MRHCVGSDFEARAGTALQRYCLAGHLPKKAKAKSQARPLNAAQAASLESVEQQQLLNDTRSRWAQNGDSPDPRIEGAVEEATGSEKFDWTKAWYPVGIERDLPSDRPTAVKLLGNNLVVWKDGEGLWRAFQDLCPHRLVPLSEGRVENGELMCSYHGWQFRGSDGQATVIPQAETEKSHATAVKSRRSCCVIYPCEADNGLVWVYGSGAKGAEIESKAVPRQVVSKIDDGSCIQVTPWFMRELPYGSEILCENMLDPSHVPFSHHGVQGNRYKVEKTKMKAAGKISPTGGFTVSSSSIGPQKKRKFSVSEFDLSFRPPTLVRYEYSSGAELVSHAVPLDPGRCRIFFTLLFPRAKLTPVLAFILKVTTSKWLLWKNHFQRNLILDGDNVFLALQDQELKRRTSVEWGKTYYMPSSLDAGVIALRQWLTHLAAPKPWGSAALPPMDGVGQTRRQMLDRFEQHTKHCKSCSAAHKVSSTLQWVASGIFAVVAAYAAFIIGNAAPLRKLLLPALGAAVAAAVAFFAGDVRQKLEYLDYRHPEHH